MLGLGMAKKGVFAKFAKSLKNGVKRLQTKYPLYLKTMLLNASGKGVPRKNLIFFPNWSELERF